VTRGSVLKLAGVVLVLAAAFLIVRRLASGANMERTVAARKDRLLRDTNLTDLRDACRGVILKYGSPGVKHLGINDERVPPIVRRLEPTDVALTLNYLRVELGDDRLHYGVESFRSRQTQVPFPFGKELMEGLWYYETAFKLDRYPD
jgi:hypothetical protein